MTNKFLPHLHILPEDDANREFANGFLLDDRVKERCIQVLKPAGGWRKALESINDCGLGRNVQRRLLLLIDFDNEVETRLPEVLASIPEEFKERVFVIGTASTPEKLRVDMGKSREEIGTEAARECVEETDDLWKHSLLQHNQEELKRLSQDVRKFIIR